MTEKKKVKVRTKILALSNDIINDECLAALSEQELIEKLKSIKAITRKFNSYASRVIYEYEKYGI